jgi:hypothetical protein
MHTRAATNNEKQIISACMVKYEHSKGRLNQPLITLYWVLLVVVDTVRLRTLALREEVCVCIAPPSYLISHPSRHTTQHQVVSSYYFAVCVVNVCVELVMVYCTCLHDFVSEKHLDPRRRCNAVICLLAQTDRQTDRQTHTQTHTHTDTHTDTH